MWTVVRLSTCLLHYSPVCISPFGPILIPPFYKYIYVWTAVRHSRRLLHHPPVFISSFGSILIALPAYSTKRPYQVPSHSHLWSIMSLNKSKKSKRGANATVASPSPSRRRPPNREEVLPDIRKIPTKLDDYPSMAVKTAINLCELGESKLKYNEFTSNQASVWLPSCFHVIRAMECKYAV